MVERMEMRMVDYLELKMAALMAFQMADSMEQWTAER